MTEPLHLPGVPMAGPDGKRHNLTRLREVLAAMLPARGVLVMEVAHDDGCPCERGRVPIERCTCERVDLTLRTADPRTS